MATKKAAAKKVTKEAIISECTDPVVVDNAPFWAKYYAIDASGEAFYYENMPFIEDDECDDSWTVKGGDYQTVEKSNVVWKKSLRSIPESRLSQLVAGKVIPSLEDIPLLIGAITSGIRR